MSWYKIAKKESPFVYGDLEKNFWRELVYKEKDRIDVHFDLENDDTVEKPRDIEIDKIFTTKGGSENKYKVTAQMMSAGGDWENQVRYFKCQCAEKTFWDAGRGWDKYEKGELTFIYIPEKKEGNANLVKRDDGGWRVTDNGEEDGEDIKDSELWDSLKKHCSKRIKKYYDAKYADYDGDFKKIFKEHGVYGKYDLVKVFGE